MVSCEGLGRGGVQAVMMNIVRSLKNEYLFDMLLFTEDVRYYDEEFLSYGGKIIRLPFYRGNNPILLRFDYYLRGWGLYRKVKKILRDNGPYDIIHCNNNFESAICVKAAKKVGVPVRIAHAHTCSTASSWHRKIADGIYRRWILKHATNKVACTESAGICRYGKTDFEIVYNSYDETKFTSQQCSLNEKIPLQLIQIGSYSSNKNQLFSLKVLKSILDNGVDAKMIFVGFGPEKETIEKSISELSLEKNVEMYPADADIPELLSRSYALLFPSIKEGFGIVLLEAQAMGVRCFVSDTVPKDANVGGCMFLPLADGAEAWAKIITDEYSRSNTHNKYDCSAFTVENIMEKYRKIYKGEER